MKNENRVYDQTCEASGKQEGKGNLRKNILLKKSRIGPGTKCGKKGKARSFVHITHSLLIHDSRFTLKLCTLHLLSISRS